MNKGYTVIFNNKDMVEGNLKVESCIRADKIYTVSKTIVVKKFGRITEKRLNSVRQRILYLIDKE